MSNPGRSLEHRRPVAREGALFPELARLMSRGFTIFLGLVELACGLGVMFGVLTQLAAIGLILVMLGAIGKKIFVWKIGFWGGKAYGWHYDLMLVVMNLVILFFAGGHWVLMK